MATRLLPPFYQVVDANGRPRSGARLYTYAAGTSTPLATYSDAGLTIANTNPVIADAAGMFGDIFIDNIEYHIVLRDANDVTVEDADPVGLIVGGASRTLLYAGALTGGAVTVPLLGATLIEFTISGGGMDAAASVGLYPRAGASQVTFDLTRTAFGGAAAALSSQTGIGISGVVLTGTGTAHIEGTLSVPPPATSGRIYASAEWHHVSTGPTWISNQIKAASSASAFNIDTVVFAVIPPATLWTGGRLVVLAKN